MTLSIRRIAALMQKETYHIMRDPSILAIGLFLPLLLLFLFGYGLSMDIKNIPFGIVAPERTRLTNQVIRSFEGTDTYQTQTYPTLQAAKADLERKDILGILQISPRWESSLERGETPTWGLTLHGVDANQATMLYTYIKATIRSTLAQSMAAKTTLPTQSTPIQIDVRNWFNEQAQSSWYLIPGLMILNMTLVGSFLTALIIAKEWERRTILSLWVTPVTRDEIFWGKLTPYFFLSVIGNAFAFLLALFLFHLPIEGNFWALIATFLLYQCVALLFGLFLSALLRRQFVAIQYAIIGSFLPALMLSGFLFDLRSVPQWIQVVGYAMPPTYAIESIKILFLSGGNATTLWINALYLAAWALGLALACRQLLQKTLGVHHV